MHIYRVKIQFLVQFFIARNIWHIYFEQMFIKRRNSEIIYSYSDAVKLDMHVNFVVFI